VASRRALLRDRSSSWLLRTSMAAWREGVYWG
jgi:hypothetical protein